MTIENQLNEWLHGYHKIMEKQFQEVWKNEIAGKANNEEELRRIFVASRKTLKQYGEKYDLDYGSIAGKFLEWTLFHLVSTGARALKKNSTVQVINGYQIPFKWKEGTSKLNLDLVIKSRKSTKIFYAFEMKTNFDDGFQKYREEEGMIYHHRQKTFSDFKYFYICVNGPKSNTFERFRNDINTLRNRGEIYCLEKDKGLPGGQEFVKAIRASFEKIN